MTQFTTQKGDVESQLRHITGCLDRSFDLVTHPSIDTFDRTFILIKTYELLRDSGIYELNGTSDEDLDDQDFHRSVQRAEGILWESIRYAVSTDEYVADEGVDKLDQYFDYTSGEGGAFHREFKRYKEDIEE